MSQQSPLILENEILGSYQESSEQSLQDYSKADKDYFESQLKDPVGDGFIGKLDQISSGLSNKKYEFEESLKRAAQTVEAKDIMQATRNMSEYSLHALMISKLASKSSNAIEKLTNLQ